MVKTRGPVTLFGLTEKVDSVMFVRLEGNDRSQYISTQPIESNWNEDGYAYLLNAPPGRYAVVATFFASRPTVESPSGGDHTYTTYFSRDLVNATEVTVEPGKIVFMGEFTVVWSTSFEEADDVQLHYLRLISPGIEDRNKFLGMLSGDYHYTATLHEVNQDGEAREKFLATTRENLGAAGWLAAIN